MSFLAFLLMRGLHTLLVFGLLVLLLGQIGLLWLGEQLAALFKQERPVKLVAVRRRLADAPGEFTV